MTVTHGYSTRAPHYVSLLLLFDVCLFVPVCGSCSAAANNEVSEYLNSNNLQLFGPFYMSSGRLCMNAEEILDNYHGLMSAYLANVI